MAMKFRNSGNGTTSFALVLEKYYEIFLKSGLPYIGINQQFDWGGLSICSKIKDKRKFNRKRKKT